MADALAAFNGASQAVTDLVTAAGTTANNNINKQAASAADANAALALDNLKVLQQSAELSKKQAQNADALDQTRVTMDQQFAASALTSLQTSFQATQNLYGVAQGLATDAVELTKQKTDLEKNKPGFFSNPLGWLVDSVRISNLEDDIATRSADATNAFNQATAVSASATRQLSDATAIHKLQTSVALDAQATMQNKGMREQQTQIEADSKRNALIAGAVDKQYAIAKDVMDYHIKELTANAEMQKARAMKTNADTLAAEKKQRDDSIDQLAQFMSKTKGTPLTPVLRNAAANLYDSYDATPEGKAQRAAILALNVKTLQYPDKQSMTAALMSNGTVGEINIAGRLMEDQTLASLGQDISAKRANEIYINNLQLAYKQATGKDASGNVRDFNDWVKILPKDIKDKYNTDSQQQASLEVLKQPVNEFARQHLSAAPEATPLNPTTWGNAALLESAYGIKQDSKASKVMTNPAVQLQIQASANATGPDTVVDTVYSLHKNFQANGLASLQENAQLIANIYKRNAAAQSYGGSSNPTYTYLKSKGLLATPSAKLMYDGKPYDLTLASDVENLLVRKDHNVNDTLGTKLGNLSEASGQLHGISFDTWLKEAVIPTMKSAAESIGIKERK